MAPAVLAALVLNAVLAVDAKDQNAPCVLPSGLSGALRDFRPPPGQELDAIRRYQECETIRGRQATESPVGGILYRNAADQHANTVMAIGRRMIKTLPFGDLIDFVDYTARSTKYTNEIKAGIRQKFDAFEKQYRGVTSPEGMNLQRARQTLAAWRELRGELQRAYDATTLPEEKALIQERMEAGSLMADFLLLDAIQGMQNASAQQIREQLEAMGIKDQELAVRLEARMDDIIRLVQGKNEPARAIDGARNVQLIGEYAAFSHSLLALGARAGMLDGRDASTLQHLVAGGAQIATAAAILQAGTYTSVTGPYGMALAGGLMIAGALQRPRESETAQMARMLQQISRQIATLQATVEQGFMQVRKDITESEMRIMAQLTRLLEQGDLILGQMERFRTDLQQLRQDMLQAAEDRRLEENSAFFKKVTYDDANCLKKFSLWQRGARADCIRRYDEVVREFAQIHNSRLAGAGRNIPSLRVGFDDQMAALIAEYERLTGRPSKLQPVHKPALDLITNRVRLFLAHNPGMRDEPRMRDIVTRLDAFAEDHSRTVSALTSDATIAAAAAAYENEVRRALTDMDRRSAQYLDTTVVTAADEIYQLEVRRKNESSSYRAQSERFADSGPRFSARIGSEGKGDYLGLGDSTLGFGPHRLIRQKLHNFGVAALRKDSLVSMVFPERLDGYFWMTPCNQQSSYLPFPISRRKLAEQLPADVVALTAAGRGNLAICYTPGVQPRGNNVGIGNTDTGMNVVNARLASLGYSKFKLYSSMGVFEQTGNPYVSFCQSNPSGYFQAQYASHPEYGASAWEKCHHGHIHHELFVRTEQMHGVTFSVTLNMPGYRSPSKSFSHSIPYTQGQFEFCFLPFDNSGSPHPAGVFAPFLQEYPLPISRACPGVDEQLLTALPAIRPQMEAFLLNEKTRPEGEPTAAEVPYGEAARTILQRRSDQNYQALLAAMFADPRGMNRIDELYVLLAAIDDLRGKVSAGVQEERLSADALRVYVSVMLRAPDNRTLRTALELMPRPAAGTEAQ